MARPRSFNEDDVLLAARDQFWSTGYATTSIDDVMAATGLGKGSIYGAFGDKHKLFVRVYSDHCAGLVARVREALEGPDEGAYERLGQHVHAAARGAAGADRRGCLLANGNAELSGRDPAVAQIALRTFDELEELLAGCIVQSQRHGDIEASADARQLAALLLAVLRGAEALGKAGRDAASLTSIADAAMAMLPRDLERRG
jgi:TetR/AcrR family transcriptional repressor of nem operon